jgi:hypothetical protein
MEGFTNVNSRRRNARKAREAAQAIARAAAEARIPGALWSDIPLSRSHLPGIPYSYYDEEIVMIRQRTAELIERQLYEARMKARAQRRRHGGPAEGQGQEWYTYEQGKIHRVSASEWQGVDE